MAQLASREMLGHVARPGPAFSYEVVNLVDVAGDLATAHACVVDDGETVNQTTGEVVVSATATSLADVTLERSENAWRVAGVEVLREWDGAVTCD